MAALALLALAACAHAQVLDTRVTTDGSSDTQNINKFVPQTTLYTSTLAADFGVTPATPVRPPQERCKGYKANCTALCSKCLHPVQCMLSVSLFRHYLSRHMWII